MTASGPPLDSADLADARPVTSHPDARPVGGDAALWGEAAPPTDRSRPTPARGSAEPTPAPQLPTAELRKLGSDLGDDDAVRRFVTVFVDLLGPRLTRIRALLVAGDSEDAVTALLTLETSGQMVGAHELVAAAGVVRARLDAAAGCGTDDRDGLDDGLDDVLASLERSAQQAAASLRAVCDPTRR